MTICRDIRKYGMINVGMRKNNANILQYKKNILFLRKINAINGRQE
jgi:hypothetical protein